MTDARTDALTAPTADPGIVAALVYVGDQIAAIATGSDRNRPRSAERPQGEGLGADAAERRTGQHRPVPAQHPIDRHLLPDPIPEPTIWLHQTGAAELVAQASWEPSQWAEWQVLNKCDEQVRALDGGIWSRVRTIDDSTYTERRVVATYEPEEGQ